MKKNAKQKEGLIARLPEYFLMLSVCFLIPALYFRITLDPVVYPRFTGLAISLFILVILIWAARKKNNFEFSVLTDRFFAFYLAYLLITVVAMFFAVNPVEGLTDLFKWILFFMLTALATILFFRSQSAFLLIRKGVIINAILVSLLGMIQYFMYAFNQDDPNTIYEVKGLMAHRNQFSISLFVMLPFILGSFETFNKTWKRLAFVSALLVFITIFLLQTRAVWIALFVGGLVVILVLLREKDTLKSYLQSKTVKRILMVIGVAIVALVLLTVLLPQYSPVMKVYQRMETLVDPEYASNEWRTEMWEATARLIKDNPVIGVGGGNWKISIYPYYGEYLPSVYRHWRNPHNDYLNIAAEKGLLGLAIFLTPFVLLVFYGMKNIKNAGNKTHFRTNTLMLAGMVGYFVVMLFSFPNERINHMMFVSLMAAYIVSARYTMKDHSVKSTKKIPVPVYIGSLIVLYLAIHFGVISIQSEVNMAKSQAAKEQRKWKFQTHFADRAYNYFAPIEPTFSFPISLYQGLGRYSQGQFEEALPYFRRAFEQHPTSISVMNNIGSTYAQLKQYDSALVYYNKTIAIFSHYEYGLMNIAKTHYVQGDYETAYKFVLSCDPKSDNKEVGLLRREIEIKLNQ